MTHECSLWVEKPSAVAVKQGVAARKLLVKRWNSKGSKLAMQVFDLWSLEENDDQEVQDHSECEPDPVFLRPMPEPQLEILPITKPTQESSTNGKIAPGQERTEGSKPNPGCEHLGGVPFQMEDEF
jgi:hypothetical protein